MYAVTPNIASKWKSFENNNIKAASYPIIFRLRVFASATARARANTVHISGNENARIYFNISRVHCSRLKNVRSRCYDKTYALLGCSVPCLKSRKQRELLVMWDDKTKNAARPQFSVAQGDGRVKKIEKQHGNVMLWNRLSFVLRALRFVLIVISSNEMLQAKKRQLYLECEGINQRDIVMEVAMIRNYKFYI